MAARRSPKTLFIRTLISAFSASAIVGFFILLLGEFGDLEIQILLTTFALGGFSLTLTGFCCAVIASK